MNETSQKDAMQYEQTSIVLTKIGLILFSIIAILLMFNGPWIIEQLMHRTSPLLSGNTRRGLFMTSGYTCGILALLCMFSLFQLVNRIGNGQIFTRENVTTLRHIGWEVMVVTILAILIGLTCYLPILAIAAAGAFMTLIIRVVRNAFGKAVAMQDELDYTV